MLIENTILFVIFLISFLLTFILVPLSKKIGIKFGIFDSINSRKVKKIDLTILEKLFLNPISGLCIFTFLSICFLDLTINLPCLSRTFIMVPGATAGQGAALHLPDCRVVVLLRLLLLGLLRLLLLLLRLLLVATTSSYY